MEFGIRNCGLFRTSVKSELYVIIVLVVLVTVSTVVFDYFARFEAYMIVHAPLDLVQVATW